jgi:hypothetical protein
MGQPSVISGGNGWLPQQRKGSDVQQFVAIIGGRNSGKSTIIKSLTSCPNSGFRGFVYDRRTSRCIYVICSSPQECDLPLQEFRHILQECTLTPNCQGLVMAIQPTRPRTRLSMETILQEIVHTGAFRVHAFMIDPGWNGIHMDIGLLNNRLARFVRMPSVLDGRRFSMINAHHVNRRTHIAR